MKCFLMCKQLWVRPYFGGTVYISHLIKQKIFMFVSHRVQSKALIKNSIVNLNEIVGYTDYVAVVYNNHKIQFHV